MAFALRHVYSWCSVVFVHAGDCCVAGVSFSIKAKESSDASTVATRPSSLLTDTDDEDHYSYHDNAQPAAGDDDVTHRIAGYNEPPSARVGVSVAGAGVAGAGDGYATGYDAGRGMVAPPAVSTTAAAAAVPQAASNTTAATPFTDRKRVGMSDCTVA